MSRKIMATFICPHCNNEVAIQIWESVNVDLNPEQKGKILNGKFFDFTCEHCRTTTKVLFSCLYHDMTHQFMIYLVGNQTEADKAVKMFYDLPINDDKTFADYQVRITTDDNVWREKAIIYDSGYDDRIVEIVKLFYLGNLKEQYPNLNVRRVFFSPEKTNNGFVLEFLCQDDNFFTAEIPNDFYRKVEKAYHSKIQQERIYQFNVDTDWAMKILKL